MKSLLLSTFLCCIALFVQAQTNVITVNTSSNGGDFATQLATMGITDAASAANITELKIIGGLKADDFSAIHSLFTTTLNTADLSGVTWFENDELPEEAFYQFTSLETIKLPTNNSLKKIGNKACEMTSGESKLKYVNFPDGLMEIGNFAFANTLLETVVLPNSVTTLGLSVFGGTSALKNITLSESLTEIPKATFINTSNTGALTEITIPESVTTIGDKVFYGQVNLKTIKLPSKLEWIGTNGVFYATAISKLEFPDGTKFIEKTSGSATLSMTFYNASNLKEIINFPTNVTSIEDNTFRGTQIASIELPEGLKTIINGAFYETPLTQIKIPSTVVEIGNMAFTNSSLTSIVLPEGLTTLSSDASYGGAFQNATALKSIDLPSTLTFIGESTFNGAKALESIIVRNPNPVIFSEQTQIFAGVDKNTCILYVPTGTVDLYKGFDLWKDFVNIREIGSNAVANEIGNFNDLIIEKGSVSTITLAATAKGDRSVAYTIEDGKTGVATLSKDVVTIVGEGTATITAKVKGDNDYQEATKTITLTVVDYSWLQEVSIAIQGKTAKVVGPSESVAKFTKFYIDNASVTATDGKIDLSDKTGDITIKATTDDGSGIIRLKANVGGTQKSAMKISDAAPLPYLLRK